jgi:hypothetical protein
MWYLYRNLGLTRGESKALGRQAVYLPYADVEPPPPEELDRLVSW